MTIQKAPGTNTLVITDQIDAMLDALEPSLPAGVQINRQIFRQADFIDLSVGNVVHALRDAGSMERLVPILMTALTAALALIPIILKGDKPGNEILAPLSVVILGGLLTSTFLNLVVVPAGYAAIHRLKSPARAGTSGPNTPDTI